MAKVVFAAGGTGGHLFPAQLLAEQLLATCPETNILFAGAHLSTNKYFDQKKFRFAEIASKTPFRGNLLKRVLSFGSMVTGMRSSLQLLKREKPDLMIGFGSFHTFPLLCAARLCKLPFILFESNAMPGKVVRLFSSQAEFTAVYFEEAMAKIKGKTIEVEIPKRVQGAIDRSEARTTLGLESDRLTLLVCGGSQGSQAINKMLLEILPCLSHLQLIHLTGSAAASKEVETLCKKLKIPCYVKIFEPRMELVWSAADLVICRAGAMTLCEMIDYEVPGILIPYPSASDQHQLKNGFCLEKMGGAIVMQESGLNAEQLQEALITLPLSKMRQALQQHKASRVKLRLSSLVQNLLELKEPL